MADIYIETGRSMSTFPGEETRLLAGRVRGLLEANADRLQFHGWRHTNFVRRKAAEFAEKRCADTRLVEAAALVHDLNYVIEADSSPDAGRTMRAALLTECGFSGEDIKRIEAMIVGAHTEWRQRHVDVETACLSDADTLYKALPITPVLFSHKYLSENRVALSDLAKKIVNEQADKLAEDYYFYDDDVSERYGHWAQANLQLWEAVLESLDDPDVVELVEGESLT